MVTQLLNIVRKLSSGNFVTIPDGKFACCFGIWKCFKRNLVKENFRLVILLAHIILKVLLPKLCQIQLEGS